MIPAGSRFFPHLTRTVSMPPYNRAKGFSLLELVMIVVILSIAAGFSSQAWQWWVSKTRHRVILESYYSLFAYARWSAVSHRSLVTVCPLSKNRCVDDWESPVSIFLDSNNDKAPDGGEILRQLNVELGTYTLRSRTAGRGYFQFNSKGMAYGAMGSLVLCPSNPAEGTMSYMPINIAGRFRAELDHDADGEIKLPWGTTIQC